MQEKDVTDCSWKSSIRVLLRCSSDHSVLKEGNRMSISMQDYSDRGDRGQW